MCAIYGIVWNDEHTQTERGHLFGVLARASSGRGRDAQSTHSARIAGRPTTLGWNRATPTTEAASGRLQPYTADGVSYFFHNGTVANDKELGGLDGEIDSEVLPRVLDTANASLLASSLLKVRGSYALAVATPNELYLAANYKPLYYCRVAGVGLVYASLASDVQAVLDSAKEDAIAPVKLEPYSVRALLAGESVRRVQPVSKVCVIASGGLDSTVAAAILRSQGKDIHLLHFSYGCRASAPELDAVRSIAQRMRCDYSVLEMPRSSVAGSTLTSDADKELAEGADGAEYAHEWVPARNFQMLALAVGWAESRGFDAVAYGGNLEESGAYPDNEMELIRILNTAMANVVHDGASMTLLDPVGHLMKHEIVSEGHRVSAPLDLTWSCYASRTLHCGKCGPCFMRRTAFARALLSDPITYAL
jgi:7-cyano-7-deazaguanine synthase